jgi:hypothetical protein
LGIGSSIDPAGKYKAGSTVPTGLPWGEDTVKAVAADKPKPKDPWGDGTRDDADPTFTRNVRVRFPWTLYCEAKEQLVQGEGASWTQKLRFVVKDQWGNPLPEVTITENPVTHCVTRPNHQPACHLDSFSHTGPGATDANGNFWDTYGAAVGSPEGKAVVTHQTYNATYGDYQKTGMLSYIVKLRHWRPDCGITNYGQAPWTDGQQLCTTNE